MTVLEGQPQPVQRMSMGASWRRAWRTGDWWRHLGLGGFLFFHVSAIHHHDNHFIQGYPAVRPLPVHCHVSAPPRQLS